MKGAIIFYIVMTLLACAGWITNIVNVITGFHHEVGILFVAQCFGIAAFPLGSVLGIASWF
ncbi:Hypothetical protein BAMTRB_013 [Escherichia phage vB_Eco_Bam]|uniref:Uncharacterized protein n=1 Tax=Escherichia phage vB_Eco_Bam TaxID=2898833 RepID=A0A9P0Y7G1_9CAUD|nr:hypothetical protein MAK_011 [Escherichia phage vB_Eco_Mak]CAH7774585.1 hypothetical protein TITUS_009 [Escherichia phage vB_Eco_Titus]CAI9888936.1 Hypothetical protein BAMTRB_013 [Escherichia phage vB_Eco_Bam]